MVAAALAQHLDLRGRVAPTLVLHEIALALEPLAVGDRIDVLVDSDPILVEDLRSWCRASSQRLVSIRSPGCETRVVLQKGSRQPRARHVGIVVSDDGVEQLLSPLGFALAASQRGYEVSLCLAGRAVRALAPDFSAPLHGISRAFSRHARSWLDGGAATSPQHLLGELRMRGAHVYVCPTSAEHHGLHLDEGPFADVETSEPQTFVERLRLEDVPVFVE